MSEPPSSRSSLVLGGEPSVLRRSRLQLDWPSPPRRATTDAASSQPKDASPRKLPSASRLKTNSTAPEGKARRTTRRARTTLSLVMASLQVDDQFPGFDEAQLFPRR